MTKFILLLLFFSASCFGSEVWTRATLRFDDIVVEEHQRYDEGYLYYHHTDVGIFRGPFCFGGRYVVERDGYFAKKGSSGYVDYSFRLGPFENRVRYLDGFRFRSTLRYRGVFVSSELFEDENRLCIGYDYEMVRLYYMWRDGDGVVGISLRIKL